VTAVAASVALGSVLTADQARRSFDLFGTKIMPEFIKRSGGKGSEDPSDPNASHRNDLPASAIRRRETRPEQPQHAGHRGIRPPALGRFRSIHWSRERSKHRDCLSEPQLSSPR
jgi:hypothetical protein